MASRSNGISAQLILAVLLGLIVLAFALGLLLTRSGGPAITGGGDDDAAASAPMFPELADTRESVARIVIAAEGADAGRVTLTCAENGWRVAPMADYPAVKGRVTAFLDTLAQAQRIERADPDAVRSTMQGDRRWRELRLETAAGEPVLTAAIGAQVSTPAATDLTATYVRPGGGDTVWLADLELGHPIAQPADWLDRELMALPREQIAEVHTAPMQGAPLHIQRVEGATGEFEAVDVDRELMADKAWKVGDLTVPFTGLRFLDARPADGEPESWPGYVTTTTGLELRFAVRKDATGYWARFKLAEAPTATESADDGAGNGAGAVEPAVDGDALRDAVAGRAFRLPEYTATRMMRGRAALERENDGDGGGNDAPADDASGTAGDGEP